MDDTLESLERARHLDSRGEEGLASLGGSDLSVSKSKSNLMLGMCVCVHVCVCACV